MVELEDGLRYWPMSGDQYVSPAMATGNYEGMETAFVRRQVRRGMAVLDVGANLGWFTVHLARLKCWLGMRLGRGRDHLVATVSAAKFRGIIVRAAHRSRPAATGCHWRTV